MRESSSWRLASAEELLRRRAAPTRPSGRTRMLIATATKTTLVGPLLACNPKSGPDDEFWDDDYTTDSGTGIADESNWDEDTDDWDDEGDGDGDDEFAPCLPLPPALNGFYVGPDQAAALSEIVADAAPGATIALLPGVYDLSQSQPIRLSKPGMILRSATDDRDSVVLEGGYQLDEIVILEGPYSAVAHVTIRHAGSHAIRVRGGVDEGANDIRIHDVAILDSGRQSVLIDRSDTGHHADSGTISCSLFELGDAGREMLDTCEVAGIEGHGAQNWNVRDNVLVGFWCNEGLAPPAISFSQSSRNTLVQRNLIEDAAQGIGFGQGEVGVGDERVYADQPCPGVNVPGHIDGIIRNNSVWTGRPELFDSPAGVHSGITLERACGAEILHNTVVSLERPSASIAYSWPDTNDAIILNNLVTHGILPFAGAQANLAGNIVDAALVEFFDAEAGELHLAPTAGAIDAGVPAGLVFDDRDGQPRVDPFDVGADEFVE